jgi:hypothetical protein
MIERLSANITVTAALLAGAAFKATAVLTR